MSNNSLQGIALNFIETRTDKSFSKLYDRLKPGLKKFIYYYHQDTEIIDEILAITLSKAFQYADKYDPQWHFSTWIYKICQNECLMEIRRKNALISLDNIFDSKMCLNAVRDIDWKEEFTYELYKDETLLEVDEIYDEVLDEIKNLPDYYRDIISDKVIDNMKYQDIAIKRNLNINTVRTRIHNAKRGIKKLWIDKKTKEGSCKNINIIGVTVLQLLDDPGVNTTLETIDNITSIEIVSARYGTSNVTINVTDEVQKLYKETKEVKASNRLGGDPCVNVKKKLYVEYTVDGVSYNTEVNEGKLFMHTLKF